MQSVKLTELFSGIGSQAMALKNLGVSVETAGTCEWDIHAFVAYDAVHNTNEILEEVDKMTREEIQKIISGYTLSNDGKEKADPKYFHSCSDAVLKRILSALIRSKNHVDINALDGGEMPNDIDIMTYSFPCQDLSNVGAFHGYNKGIDKGSGSRSSLLWQVGRVLSEMKTAGKTMPRYLLMENVPALLAPRHFANFQTWISDLKQLGYVSQYYRLNALDFGLPQNRPRLLMISVYTGDDAKLTQEVIDYFATKTGNDVISDYKKSAYYHPKKLSDLLRTDYTNEKLLAEAIECTPNDTVSRKVIWENNPQIVLEDGRINPLYDHVRTLTTKQDRHPNSGNLYFNSHLPGRSTFRYLTPRECLLFMGFTDEDYEKITANNTLAHHNHCLFPRDKIIRMAGNSIPVKLLEGIFYQIILLDAFTGKIKEEPGRPTV